MKLSDEIGVKSAVRAHQRYQFIFEKHHGKGEYRLLSGNETGLLLLDYICSQRIRHGKMPSDPVMVKTIVTTELGERIAAHYGVETRNVLTGFKFIGEQIGLLEREGRADRYIFGFEESYGYLSGSYVRDKDGVNAACLICEMFSYYRTKGVSLIEKLDELYRKYGYCLNTLHSYEFDGASGFETMQNIMKKFRGTIETIGTKKVIRCLDYSVGVNGLPKLLLCSIYSLIPPVQTVPCWITLFISNSNRALIILNI